ncbi:hypothetical protein KIW84_035589 [Lathyrus oleraceus]|uniref:Uncharacterized protein n=1 Tax=Pisum sativum TaxID=3888 RepID=A0A9D5B6V4_PEA|nr:hypothetical protein KIW84_035589 [Pisum sativum]
MTLSAITISSSSSFTPYGISCSLLATGCLCSASCIRCLILVTIDIQVTMGFSIRQVILQEIKNYNVSWIVLDRHLWRDMRFHLTKIPCKVALVKDDLSVNIWRYYNAHDTNVTTFYEHYIFTISSNF